MAEYWRRFRRPLTATLILASLAAIALLIGFPGSHILGGVLLVAAVTRLIAIKYDLLRGPDDDDTDYQNE